MLVQLNRHTDDRPFTATTPRMPLNPPYTRSTNPVVAVLGPPGRVAALAGQLPAGWSVRAARDLGDVRAEEIVLVSGATEAGVHAARAALPQHTLVALVDATAPGSVVADVLTAGADVCVRGGVTAVLAGHLVACRRRQLADRWSGLLADATRA